MENTIPFYSLPKDKRNSLVEKINADVLRDMQDGSLTRLMVHFSHADTYIRKVAYQAAGRIYREHKGLRKKIIVLLGRLLQEEDVKIRQTAVNAAGEIGTGAFESVEFYFDRALFDAHSSVRNAVIGSVKKMGAKNPVPVLNWAKKYLHHEDKEVRREICHGIELRGRTHPQDILPLLRELELDSTARVRNTLIHVLGQISYKKGCLETVVRHLKTWRNKALVEKALEEIIDVHERYKDFAVLTQREARRFIKKHISTKHLE